MRHLADAWLRTAAAVGARGDVAGAGADLLARWAQPHRRYHDVRHLAVVHARLDELAARAPAVPETVRLGAWFHDAVYDPTASDNEARSALLADKVLTGLRVPTDTAAEVVRLVTLTGAHDPAPGDEAGALLSDADLAVLASDDHGYRAYVTAVREEYAHLDDQAFARGRAQVLHSLLDRPTLFATGYGRATWERPARGNVEAELARLKSTG